ncbi:hypothetical protein [Streptomyces sp. NPDC091212]|uniref:hypothetical protein n=1 Tax=Streptomyces sp. NPDC091212 TaxID=3155191 RepID=UPI003420FFDD
MGIHYNGPGGKKQPLRGGMAFVLYWENGDDGRKMHPVGLIGKDMSPKAGAPSGLVQFRFSTTATELDTYALRTSQLQWRPGNGHWQSLYLRKGKDYYLATDGDWKMPAIKDAAITSAHIAFRLRMDIAGKGDMWISDDQNTGSIRMRDTEDASARLVAVRRGPDDAPDDPFGTEQNFPVYTLDELNNI